MSPWLHLPVCWVTLHDLTTNTNLTISPSYCCFFKAFIWIMFVKNLQICRNDQSLPKHSASTLLIDNFQGFAIWIQGRRKIMYLKIRSGLFHFCVTISNPECKMSFSKMWGFLLIRSVKDEGQKRGIVALIHVCWVHITNLKLYKSILEDGA